MMSKLRVGVVGVGHLGSKHAELYNEISAAEFIGIYDIDKSRADATAKQYKIKAFSSLDQLLGEVKAISIVTPTSTHFAVATEALQRGVNVLIEKPITSTVIEAESLLQLAKRHGAKIQVGHVERFNPAILALEKYTINPIFVESHRLAQFNPRGTDVAVVLDLMIHDIDIILSLVQSPVRKIEANGVAVVSDNIDIANARLQFENGCVANVTASRISQKKMRKMRLFQRDAYISIDFSEGLAEVFRLVDEDDHSVRATMLLGEINSGKMKRRIVYEQPEVKEINALKYELEQFVDSIQNGREPIVTGSEGKEALQIAHDIMAKISQQSISY
ncbi:MAG TPA: Gfo/Idh/MocA family oxidoreductase [Bacteroidota bacterium]|nr:Gfo/Idh/MocA family oxidoreductase [Bacteroidota bacterium]